MSVWKPSPAQSRAADLLAQCWTQTAVAQETGTDLRTIQRWWHQAEFRQYVRDIQLGYAEGYNEEFAILVAEALMIERQALRGEMPRDDPRAELAHDILSRTAYRIAVNASAQPKHSFGPHGIDRGPGQYLQQLRDASGDSAAT